MVTEALGGIITSPTRFTPETFALMEGPPLAMMNGAEGSVHMMNDLSGPLAGFGASMGSGGPAPQLGASPRGQVAMSAAPVSPGATAQQPVEASDEPGVITELNDIIGQKQRALDGSQLVMSPSSTPKAGSQVAVEPGVAVQAAHSTPHLMALTAQPQVQAHMAAVARQPVVQNSVGGAGITGLTGGGARPPAQGVKPQLLPTRTSARGLSRVASVSKSIEEACHAAALEDGVLADGGIGLTSVVGEKPPPVVVVTTGATKAPTAKEAKSKAKNGLRRGKWTPEEEAYANRLIVEFKSGLLPLTDGTTLRTFLSKLLNCDPMRISKKFVGQNCIGKQVFRRRQADLDRLSSDDIERSRQELAELERKFLERVAQTNRCKNSGVGGRDHPGAVAPDLNRREQEYLQPNGSIMNGPVIPPWMLPPYPPSAGGSSKQQVKQEPTDSDAPASTPRGRKATGAGARRAAQQQQATNKATAAPPAAPTPVISPPPTLSSSDTPNSPSPTVSLLTAAPPALAVGLSEKTSIARNDSQDSLAAFAQSFSGADLNLSDLPRNSSLADLCSLGVFPNSPFPSSDNLLNLANVSQVAQAISAHQQNGSLSASSSSLATALPSTSFSSTAPAPAYEEVSGAPAAVPPSFFSSQGPAEGASAAKPPPKPPSESHSTRLSQMHARIPRIESATGLSSLRFHAGMSRNSSVEDFLSLVANGDIPTPDSDALSTAIFPGHRPPDTTSTVSSAGVPQHVMPARAETGEAAVAGTAGLEGLKGPSRAATADDQTALAGRVSPIFCSSMLPPNGIGRPPAGAELGDRGMGGKRAREVGGHVQVGLEQLNKQPKLEPGV